MKQVKQVHLLPTDNKASHIVLYDERNKLLFEKQSKTAAWGWQNIYFTDKSEIKEGDWMISAIGNNIVRAGNSTIVNVPITNGKKCLKIISSTDKEITPNSWIQDSFVKKYIEMYNAGTPITEVNLEYEDAIFGEHTELMNFSSKILKTREDGSIIISNSKTYTRQQMQKLANEIWKLDKEGAYLSKDTVNEIIDNL